MIPLGVAARPSSGWGLKPETHDPLAARSQGHPGDFRLEGGGGEARVPAMDHALRHDLPRAPGLWRDESRLSQLERLLDATRTMIASAAQLRLTELRGRP
jgi:hypothetical protein